MKKIKNKFIIFIIFILSLGIGIFFYLNKEVNIGTSLVLKSGEAHIYRGESMIPLNLQTRYSANEGDSIITTTDDSLLIITWGDGSLTRLGGNTEIKIENNYVSTDLSEIQIKFEMLAGKSWSNVTSFFGEKSYFLQTFNDHEAAVRGTIYNVDLENQVLYVTSHGVDLQDIATGNSVFISEREPYLYTQDIFTTIPDYIINYKDIAWDKINNSLDELYLEDLKNIMLENLQSSSDFLQLDKISEKLNSIKNSDLLDENERNKIYNDLLEKYQQLHFVGTDNQSLMGLKLDIKKQLFKFASEKEKEYLVESTIYDAQDIAKEKDIYNFQKTLEIFIENKDILDSLNISLSDVFDIGELAGELQLLIHEQLDNFASLFTPESLSNFKKIDFIEINNNLNNQIQGVIKGVVDGSYNSPIDFVEINNNLFDSIKNFFKNISIL